MNTRFFFLAFVAGLLALGWVGVSFVGTSVLALVVTASIAGAYLVGAWELRQFRAATAGLRVALEALTAPPATLPDWLERLPAPLRSAVRSRIEGERVALPGPALAPYLVGLLVMLGMLGTFLGMVITFKGAVFALQGSTDLNAIRAALAEPIRGLGLSFGTSVAGVAASAMLGLMSAIARRERLEAARLLEGRITTELSSFSAGHQRKETLRALQAQADALPEVVTALHAVMDRIERRSEQLDAQLLERQDVLQREVTRAYGDLARQVGASMQDNLAAHTRAAGQTIQPIVEQAMDKVVAETQRMHQRLGEVAQAQVDAIGQQFAAAEQQRLAVWTGLLEQSHRLVASREETEARWVQEQGRRMDGLSTLWRTELGALRDQESQRVDAAVQRLGGLEAAVSQHLASLGAALEAPITRLLQTAAEVPQAAAAVIGQLREEMSRVAERDNLALQERSLLLERLGALVQSLEQGSVAQKAAVEAMVGSATSVLEQAASRFTQTLEAQAAQAEQLGTQVTASASELAGLGESFGDSVRLFTASHDKLTGTLERVEAALGKSTARSDEQLAYYVAQAREVIDLSLTSQQGLLETMRQLQGKGQKAQAAPEVASA